MELDEEVGGLSEVEARVGNELDAQCVRLRLVVPAVRQLEHDLGERRQRELFVWGASRVVVVRVMP